MGAPTRAAKLRELEAELATKAKEPAKAASDAAEFRAPVSQPTPLRFVFDLQNPNVNAEPNRGERKLPPPITAARPLLTAIEEHHSAVRPPLTTFDIGMMAAERVAERMAREAESAEVNRRTMLSLEKLAEANPGKSEAARDPKQVKKKRSTGKGEAREKMIGVLTKHHEYADGGCLNAEPIASNELARKAPCSKAAASGFFKDEFGSHSQYKVVCRSAPRLAESIKAIRGEFSPLDLYGRRPAGEDDRDDGADDE